MAIPISPHQIAEVKENYFPDAVIDCWNMMIAENYYSGTAIIKQDKIVQALAGAMGVERHTVFDSGWLYIEDLYRARGWKVEYDKPGYNETYEPTFTFSKK